MYHRQHLAARPGSALAAELEQLQPQPLRCSKRGREVAGLDQGPAEVAGAGGELENVAEAGKGSEGAAGVDGGLERGAGTGKGLEAAAGVGRDLEGGAGAGGRQGGAASPLQDTEQRALPGWIPRTAPAHAPVGQPAAAGPLPANKAAVAGAACAPAMSVASTASAPVGSQVLRVPRRSMASASRTQRLPPQAPTPPPAASAAGATAKAVHAAAGHAQASVPQATAPARGPSGTVQPPPPRSAGSDMPGSRVQRLGLFGQLRSRTLQQLRQQPELLAKAGFWRAKPNVVHKRQSHAAAVPTAVTQGA